MRFQYLEPGSLEEAISFLQQHEGQAKVIAGGTDLMVKLKNKILQMAYVIDLESVPGLDNIRFSAPEGLSIGALTKISDLE